MTCRLLILITAAVLIIGELRAADSPSLKPDRVKDALRKKQFPWYDATKESFRPLFPQRQKQASAPPIDQPREVAPTSSERSLPFNLSIPQLAIWLFLIAVLGVLIYMIFRHFDGMEFVAEAAPKAANPQLSLQAAEALPEPTRGVVDLIGEAERLAAEAKFQSAIAFYFAWQLVQLDNRKFIELAKGKTNRQYLRELTKRMPELCEKFSDSTRLFEDAFFGNLPVSSEDYSRVWGYRTSFRAPPRVKP